MRYKYEILTPDGDLVLKADPFAQEAEVAAEDRLGRDPSRTTAGRTPTGSSGAPRRRSRSDEPLSIYEVHLGSWRLNTLEGNRPLTYLELADELVGYAVDLGFTHVELLPVMAHPFSGSWGYQVTGYFAPDPALRLARRPAPPSSTGCTQRGVGVILDWVPAHFPRDEFALARFDGTALYEHDGPAPRRPPRLGHARLQLRPQRGAQLPARERALLARRVPRRRAARRRRRLDALPRLLP